MMRRLLIAFLLVVASSMRGQDAPAPPPVPQAVKALEYLKPQPNSGPTSWTNGPYGYDGAGNITAIGSESYVYDKIGRLKTATLRGPDLSSMQTQSFDYDPYGNLVSTSKLGQTVLLPTSTATNQLGTLHYDASGRVDIAGTQHYDYDAVGMVNTVRLGTNVQPRIVYGYTADDERLFAFDVSTGITHWTLRGLDNKVLRDFKQSGSTWSVERDYVYRDGLLLAALKSGGAVEHYSLDHLGTPRLITDAAGHKIGYHVYWPFGEEWSAGSAQDGSPVKFTGHERDADPTGGSAPLDYMHVRYYGAAWGRFLSVDPTWDSADIGRPQSWNRYGYVLNNPVGRTDPDGRCSFGAVLFGGIGCGVESAVKGAIQDYHDAKEAIAGMGRDFPANENLMGGAVLTLVGAKYAAMAAGGESAGASEGTGAVVAEVNLAARATAIQSALPAATQRYTTTAVGRVASADGTVQILVASSERALRPAQRAAMLPGEVAVTGAGHAEQTILSAASANRQTVQAVAASRPICSSCAAAITQAGAVTASVLKRVAETAAQVGP